MNQKIPTLTGTAIIIILAMAAGYFVWLLQKNNPIEIRPQLVKINPVDETANWQTYKNDKFGFEVKYPSQFTAIEETNPVQSANITTVYFAMNDIAEKIKNNPKSSDNTVVDSVWNDLVDTNNVEKTFHMNWYNLENPANPNVSDIKYKQDFMDNYSGLINGSDFSAKIISFKKINTASDIQARVIIGEQWKKENTSNILVNKIFEAEFIKGNKTAKFYVNIPASNSLLISPEQFEKVVSSLKLDF